MPRFHKAKEGDLIPISDYNMKSDYLEALVNMKVVGGRFIVNRAGATLDVSGGPQTLLAWVSLDEDLEAPAIYSTPTKASATRQMKVGTSEDGIDSSDTETVEVINRDPNFSAFAGEVILVARVHVGTAMEWQPLNPFGAGGSGTGTVEESTLGCTCGDCVAGITIPSATVCCQSSLEWAFRDPWIGEFRVLQYAGNDIWVTDQFEGLPCPCSDGGDCNCLGDPEVSCSNEYRWVLTPSITPGSSVLELELVVDNGCDTACIKYRGLAAWQCLCPNTMDRDGDWANIGLTVEGSRRQLDCRLCISPQEIDVVISPQPFCTLTQEELPIAWHYYHDDFEGGIYGCLGSPANRYHEMYKYSGTYDAGTYGGIDVYMDANVAKAFPLVFYSISAGSSVLATSTWETNADFTDSTCNPNVFGGRGGALVGETWCPTCCLSGAEGQPKIIGKTRLSIGCREVLDSGGNPEPDRYDIVLSIHIAHRANVDFDDANHPNFPPQGVLSFSKTIPDVYIDSIPCEINQPHTLTRAAATFDQCNCSDDSYCEKFDPPLDDPSWPTDVTIVPYGGGPPDCPNPPLDEQPASSYPNSSGACSTCTPDTTTPDPDDGSCCVSGVCLQYISAALCTAFGGDTYGNEEECGEECFNAACCSSDGTCDDATDRLTCINAAGQWIEGVNCEQITCAANTLGTCCLSGGICYAASASELECDTAGGTFNVGFSDCSICTGGACCRSDGSCDDDVAEVDCDGVGEYWWGLGTTCATVDGCHSCCVSNLGGGSEDCVTDGDCDCVAVGSEAECFALSGSDNSKAYNVAPCAARICECDAGSETCGNNPA